MTWTYYPDAQHTVEVWLRGSCIGIRSENFVFYIEPGRTAGDLCNQLNTSNWHYSTIPAGTWIPERAAHLKRLCQPATGEPMHNPDHYSTSTQRRNVKYKSHGLKPWTPQDRRGWRTDPELTNTNE